MDEKKCSSCEGIEFADGKCAKCGAEEPKVEVSAPAEVSEPVEAPAPEETPAQ